MESQPQNPEFRINPENFHPCMYLLSKLTALRISNTQNLLSLRALNTHKPSKKIFQKCQLSNILSGLFWVKNVYKGYQQTAIEGKGLKWPRTFIKMTKNF